MQFGMGGGRFRSSRMSRRPPKECRPAHVRSHPSGSFHHSALAISNAISRSMYGLSPPAGNRSAASESSSETAIDRDAGIDDQTHRTTPTIATRWRRRSIGSIPVQGPFRGRPRQWNSLTDIPIRARERTRRERHPPERRIADLRARGAKTVWQLAYTGSVGSQVLLGLPAIERLIADRRIEGGSEVWPFQAGLLALRTPLAFAEIYPSLLNRRCTDAMRSNVARRPRNHDEEAFRTLSRGRGCALPRTPGLPPDRCEGSPSRLRGSASD